METRYGYAVLKFDAAARRWVPMKWLQSRTVAQNVAGIYDDDARVKIWPARAEGVVVELPTGGTFFQVKKILQ